MNESAEARPNPNQSYEAILDECLTAVLAGEATPQACASRYPDYADALRADLNAALLTRRLKNPVMPPQSVSALEERLRAKMRPIKATKPPAKRPLRPVFSLQRLAAVLALVFALTLGSGGAVIALAADDQPGETLYEVKRWWEDIVLLFAEIAGWVDEMWLHLAQVRWEELRALLEAGRVTSQALADFNEALSIAQYYADELTGPRLVAFMAEVRGQWDALSQDANLTTIDALAVERIDLILSLERDAEGRFVTPPPTVTPTLTPTPTLSPTRTPSPTLTAAPTLTATLTLSPTSTPRIPPTPTRTPTPSPTPTPTFTVTPSPTATWTPLPLPVGPPRNPTATPRVIVPPPTNDQGGNDSTRPTATPTATLSAEDLTNYFYFVRETATAVFATQTAAAEERN